VVARRAAAQGIDSPATLQSRTTYANDLDTLGRYNESEAAWRGLAEAKGRVLGATHVDTQAARTKHAIALYELGRFQEAAVEFGEVATQRKAAVGADHPDTRHVRDWHAAAVRKRA
jgi:eukaryotic-like serine/threonine-protein kinase